jgi:hypothetical protein
MKKNSSNLSWPASRLPESKPGSQQWLYHDWEPAFNTSAKGAVEPLVSSASFPRSEIKGFVYSGLLERWSALFFEFIGAFRLSCYKNVFDK